MDDAPKVTVMNINGVECYVLSVPLEPDLPDSLTRSEREVVLLALSGASNAEIAEERGSAFEKMGVNSRGELAAVVYGPTLNDL